MGPYGRLSYCFRHRPAQGSAVTVDHVLEARRMMSEGLDLPDIASRLGVMSRDLDVALWQLVGRFDESRRYVAEFVA